MKRVISLLVLMAMIAGMIFLLKMNKRNNQLKAGLAAQHTGSVPVVIDVVKEGAISGAFTSNGTLEPINELAFVSDASGRVLQILVAKGDWVTKGQPLIKVDDELLKADFMASEATYNALKTDYDRFKNASEKGGVSTQQMDNIRTQYIAAESRYLASKRRLSDALIKAPVSGVINERYIQTGALLNPGVRLFDIVDDTKLKLRCSVSEKQVLKLKAGLQVDISSSTFPQEVFTGVVTFIGARADRGLSFPVEITLDRKGGLKSGMYVTAHFNRDLESVGLLIPRSAVSGSVKSAQVFVVENGRAQHRDVVIGSIAGKQVEAVQGLKAGDSIVVAGLINVADGVLVSNKK